MPALQLLSQTPRFRASAQTGLGAAGTGAAHLRHLADTMTTSRPEPGWSGPEATPDSPRTLELRQ